MQDIYKYTPETNHVSEVYIAAVIQDLSYNSWHMECYFLC